MDDKPVYRMTMTADFESKDDLKKTEAALLTFFTHAGASVTVNGNAVSRPKIIQGTLDSCREQFRWMTQADAFIARWIAVLVVALAVFTVTLWLTK